MSNAFVQELADTMVLGALLERVRESFGSYELVAHWKQGEFHHDVVVRLSRTDARLPGPVLVIATNCNGGVKEVLSFAELPDRWALWHWRCPQVSDFSGDLTPVLAQAHTPHFFDPCELLSHDTRSELRVEFRERQAGGGWELRTPGPSKGRCGSPPDGAL